VDLLRDGGDEARLKLRTVLRQVVENIYVVIVPHGDAHLAYLQVFFTGGNSREYLVCYVRGRPFRPAVWCAATWSDSWGTGEHFSLKDPHRAKQVYRQLTPSGDMTAVPPDQWDRLWITPVLEWVEGDDEQPHLVGYKSHWVAEGEEPPEGGEPYIPGLAELIEAMRAAAAPDGGSPDPDVIGRLIVAVLGKGGRRFHGRQPHVE
jgi:hypothetical protein